MANLCCSIELEPRTLRGGQLNHAREVAADFAQKLEPSDATIIFIEGLRPVGSIKKMKQIIEEEEEEDGRDNDDQVVGFKETKAQINEMPCQCTCACTAATASTDSLEQEKLIREPLSAPF